MLSKLKNRFGAKILGETDEWDDHEPRDARDDSDEQDEDKRDEDDGEWEIVEPVRAISAVCQRAASYRAGLMKLNKETKRTRPGASQVDPTRSFDIEQPAYTFLLRDREAAKIAIETANSRLRQEHLRLAADNIATANECRRKEDLLHQEQAEERALITATAQIAVKITGMISQLEGLIGTEQYHRWNKSRGGALKPKPTVPAALQGISKTILKEYIHADRPTHRK
ncbi:hypothetical protein DFH06DRAFT_1320093 [Mycena polygramma]|nr:hypothetical protein DFH06DRAFT_1320093 [Mycena polygramma]